MTHTPCLVVIFFYLSSFIKIKKKTLSSHILRNVMFFTQVLLFLNRVSSFFENFMEHFVF